MGAKVGRRHERLVADVALVRFLASVNPRVLDQTRRGGEGFPAVLASVRLLALVRPLVIVQAVPVCVPTRQENQIQIDDRQSFDIVGKRSYVFAPLEPSVLTVHVWERHLLGHRGQA